MKSISMENRSVYYSESFLVILSEAKNLSICIFRHSRKYRICHSRNHLSGIQSSVIPAKAGIQREKYTWIPFYTGMTKKEYENNAICEGRPMCLPKEPSFGEKEWVE